MAVLKRTVYSTQVEQTLVGQEVIFAGWVNHRRDHGGVIFIDLRDRNGLVQLVFNPELLGEELMNIAHTLRMEYVLTAKGTLVNRDEAMINPKMATGKFEIKITDFTLHATSEPMPFQLENAKKVSEDVRLKYRYLDLRRPEMQNILKLRHEVNMFTRNFLSEREFYEVETPVLSKSTPEGARDYVVPFRGEPGLVYALPQSPQIYKQLLMCSGIDKYFQIARCFRDEALRADRQPEFSQLDIEMSFIDEEDIYQLCENYFSQLLKKFLNFDVGGPLKRRSYQEVFDAYGSDRPDTRFDMKIVDVTELFVDNELGFLQEVIKSGGKLGAVCFKNRAFSRSELDGWVSKVVKEYGANGMIYVRFKEDGSSGGSVGKYLPDNFYERAKKLMPDLGLNDTLFVIAGEYKDAWSLLGKLRLELAQTYDQIDKTKHDLFWVTDFPLFDWSKEDKRWTATHHPFTSPQKGWENQEPGDMKARAYDLVWNGYEMGGGSIRIHDAQTQLKIFDILGISADQANDKFGFLMQAQGFGYPPEGGIAFGVDRIVMNLAGTDSIRDVIAFPKTQKGSCLMMQAPSAADKAQWQELGLKISKD